MHRAVLEMFCLLAGPLPTSAQVPEMGGIQSKSREGLNG